MEHLWREFNFKVPLQGGFQFDYLSSEVMSMLNMSKYDFSESAKSKQPICEIVIISHLILTRNLHINN